LWKRLQTDIYKEIVEIQEGALDQLAN